MNDAEHSPAACKALEPCCGDPAIADAANSLMLDIIA
jgi:hypothetical protein